MLFLSFLFILAGTSMAAAAGVMITYTLINTGEKVSLLKPRDWTPAIRKWARLAGYGMASTLAGMILAIIAT